MMSAREEESNRSASNENGGKRRKFIQELRRVKQEYRKIEFHWRIAETEATSVKALYNIISGEIRNSRGINSTLHKTVADNNRVMKNQKGRVLSSEAWAFWSKKSQTRNTYSVGHHNNGVCWAAWANHLFESTEFIPGKAFRKWLISLWEPFVTRIIEIKHKCGLTFLFVITIQAKILEITI